MPLRVYRISRLTKKIPKSTRGQSLVEFSIVSLFLFMLLFGIIEMGRFLLVYNVVSNSAQEGVRYGIIRPRDLFSASEAANRRTLGTPVPTQVVVADGSCNVIDKTREKVWGLSSSDLKVAVWFDNGNGTPTAVPMDYDELSKATLPGNRINVESVYHYDFIVPFFQVFAPRGIDVKMRSARTIIRWGDEQDNCTVSMAPAPTYTAAPANTPTSTATSILPTLTILVPTSTRTATVIVTGTATTAPTSTNTATPTNTSISTNTTVPSSSTPTRTFTSVPTTTPVPTGTATPFTSTNTVVPPSSTATNTGTPLPIGTATSTSTSVATATRTATATATATPTRRLVISALHLKKRTGATGTLDIGIDLKDDLGNLINGATVNSTGSFAGALPNVGTGIYGFCKTGSYPDPASNVTVTISASKVGYQPVSITASATSGYDPLCGP